MLQKIVVAMKLNGKDQKIPFLLNEELIKKALFLKEGDKFTVDDKEQTAPEDGFVVVTYELGPVYQKTEDNNNQIIDYKLVPQTHWCPAEDNEYLKVQYR